MSTGTWLGRPGRSRQVPSTPPPARRTWRVVTFTSLYPDENRPGHGIFVENRLRHLVATGRVQTVVVSPVPWFPFAHHAFRRYAAFARVPRREMRHGIPVLHPRYPALPHLNMSLSPLSMFGATRALIRRVIRAGFDFDLLDAYYLFPCGVAAAMLGRSFRKPVVISALGTDLNVIADYAVPRRFIGWTMRNTAAITTVSEALRQKALLLGAPEHNVEVVRHGVDLEMFRPLDRETCRQALNLKGPVLLCVGHLIELKGQHLAVQALSRLPHCSLVIVGEGVEGPALRHLATSLGVADRVRFVEHVDQADLKEYYSAADALLLPSSSEGIANVCLEAMACGTPVVATGVSGTPEVVSTPAAGVLMEDRTPEALAKAVRALLSAPPERLDTRRHAEGFTWQETSRRHLAVFDRILDPGRALRMPAPDRPEREREPMALDGARVRD